MDQPPPELSIVIPAYNEERRLPETLRRVREYLSTRPASAEVIVVDDGSSDRSAAVVEEWRSKFAGLRLLSNGRNRGKGYSVRHGMLEARGRIVLFTDADLSAPIEEADKLLAALGDYEVAIGSRGVDPSLIEVHQSPLRELAGKVFNAVVRAVTGLDFTDTQCGFKAFVREHARIVFEQQRIERFGFDPEILFLAKRHGLRAIEIPVRWAHDPQTKVNMIRDSLRMFGEVLAIRWNWLLGRYPKKRQ
ncbi:MAG: glycosyl transferase [Acidobacteria bacterium]|nr:MAG: glycosyl transferase [Acidobacteriota bacterium]